MKIVFLQTGVSLKDVCIPIVWKNSHGLVERVEIAKNSGGHIPPVVRWKSGQTQSHKGKPELLELKPLKHDTISGRHKFHSKHRFFSSSSKQRILYLIKQTIFFMKIVF